jgi:hypothetical protein
MPSNRFLVVFAHLAHHLLSRKTAPPIMGRFSRFIWLFAKIILADDHIEMQNDGFIPRFTLSCLLDTQHLVLDLHEQMYYNTFRQVSCSVCGMMYLRSGEQ